jgi:hypothetical protein
MPNEKCYRRRRGFLGGQDEVSLVLAVHTVGYDDEFAGDDGGERCLDAARDRIGAHE